MKFINRIGGTIVIDATREDKLALAELVRSSIDADDDTLETLEEDACVCMDDMVAIHQVIMSQIVTEGPLVFEKNHFWVIAQLAGAWKGYFFDLYSPECFKLLGVKKKTVDAVVRMAKLIMGQD